MNEENKIDLVTARRMVLQVLTKQVLRDDLSVDVIMCLTNVYAILSAVGEEEFEEDLIGCKQVTKE